MYSDKLKGCLGYRDIEERLYDYYSQAMHWLKVWVNVGKRRSEERRDGEKILICVYLLSVIVFPYNIKETNNIIRTVNV